MGLPSDTFIRWVANKLRDITEQGGYERLELWHQNEAGGGDVLDKFPLVSESGGDLDPSDVAQMIHDTAEADESTRYSGTVQRYVVLAYRVNGEEPESQTSFVLNSRKASAGFQSDTEPANEKGLLSQLMRHTERLQLMLVNLNDSTSARLISENRELTSRAKRAEDSIWQVTEMQQKLLDRTLERELTQAAAVQSARRTDQLMEFVVGMAPLVAAKIIGTKSAPSGAPGLGSGLRDQAVGKLLANLSEDEVMGVMQSLAPDNRLRITELYQSYAHDMKEAESQKPTVLQDPNVVGSADGGAESSSSEVYAPSVEAVVEEHAAPKASKKATPRAVASKRKPVPKARAVKKAPKLVTEQPEEASVSSLLSRSKNKSSKADKPGSNKKQSAARSRAAKKGN